MSQAVEAQQLKTVSFAKLTETIAGLKQQGKKIVLCHGVFDLLHIGHLRYFKQAKTMGDVLVVTITPDCHVDKGPHRPAFTQDLRAEAVASVESVDYVAINEWPTAEETLSLLRPDVYVKGAEFKGITTDPTGKMEKELKVVEQIGCRMAFVEDIIFSSTNLINRYLSTFPEEVSSYLELFRHRYSLADVFAVLDKMMNLKVLVLGDTILDEYHYCEAIGISSKDPVLAVQHRSSDLFAGGVLAVANHLAEFAGTVELVTVLGELRPQEEFIRAQLHSRITPHFRYKPQAPTTTKTRFVEGYTLAKLFEVYDMDDSGLGVESLNGMAQWLEAELPRFDLVIVSDFGHGFFQKELIDLLCRCPAYLAVNTQANAGNRGFNTITKYRRANYACIAEHEMRLEMRDQSGSIKPMMLDIKKSLSLDRFMVTTGKKGCTLLRVEDGYVEVPAFAQKTVDRVGVGDAFFALTSLAAFLDAPEEIIAFLGNAAGAMAANIVGNKKAINKDAMKKFVTSLMK